MSEENRTPLSGPLNEPFSLAAGIILPFFARLQVPIPEAHATLRS